MFEFLSDLAPSEAIGGIYYAVRLLRHGHGTCDDARSRWFPELLTEPSQHHVALARRIIAAIREGQRGAAETLSTQTAEHYTRILADLAEESALRQVEYDKSKVRNLLEKLRHDYRIPA